MIRVSNSAPQRVLSFVRANDRHKVLALFNFSAVPQQVELSETLAHGEYTEFFTGNVAKLTAETSIALSPWGYAIYTRDESSGRRE